MINSPRIMVIISALSGRSPALLRAISLARKSGASLLLSSFEYVRSLERAAMQGFDLDAYLKGRRDTLEKFADGIRREGLNVDCAVIWGRPLSEKIIFETLALKPDLVVKDATSESVLNRAFFSGLDWSLLARCPAPLMFVHPSSASLPRRILAAVDPMDEHGKPHTLNIDILKTATTLSMQCGARLDVATAFEFIPRASEYEYIGWMPDMTLYDDLRKGHAEALYKLGREFSIPPGAMHVLNGDPARAIAGFAADKHVDLVVMGSVYRTGLKHLFIGSTAEGVFDRLASDVLVLKPQGYSAELTALLESAPSKAA
ncbi:MAG TPA: universal stress protein [Gammaproteobacteria bacterium]|nr:universal stress protein [Gammaproteobacteria bacterium]